MKNDHVSQRRLMYILIFALCAIVPEGAYSLSSTPANLLTHQFTHANIWHLLVNVVALIGVCEVVCITLNPVKTLLVAYMTSVVAAIISAGDIPTVGMSGMVYFLVGMFYMLSFGGKVLKIAKPTQFKWGLMSFAVVTIATIFIPTIATLNHIVSIVIGVIYGGLEHLQYSKYYK